MASAKSGESGKLIESGETRLGGKIPVNTSGGLKAKGHPVGATGTAQAYEMYLQLTGQAGKRQVKDAKVGLTHNVGGSGATAASSHLQESPIMSHQEPFTIEQFYKFMQQGKAYGWKMPKMRKNPFATPTLMRQLLLQRVQMD